MKGVFQGKPITGQPKDTECPDRIKVLLIEDEPGDAELMRIQLQASDTGHFSVHLAASLTAARGLINGGLHPDVVLLDLNLPDSIGPDTVRRCRSYTDAPVIVMTGLDDLSSIRSAIDAGAEDYLTKGGDVSSLVRAIRYAMLRHRRDADARLTTTVFSHVREGIVITAVDGTIINVNDAFSRITGYSRDDIMGRNPRLFKSGRHSREFYNGLWSTLIEAGHWSGEIWNRRKNGTTYPAHLTISAVHDGSANVQHYVALLIDISERKQAEQELLEATSRANLMAVQAEAANVAKSEFLANMSHEIRTPINGVLGITDLLLDTTLSSEQRHYAETIRAGGASLLRLINDILDFSKIEAGKLDLEIIDFNLQTLLDDVAGVMAMQAQAKDLEFICDLDPATPSLLRGDPGRIRQILINLVGNAVKFTEQGEVVLHIEAVAETASELTLQISVSDTGIGIAEDKRDRLFKSFSQVDASTTRKFGGTGLGLAITKQLVDMMGGTIDVTGRPGKGSEFRVRLNLERQSAVCEWPLKADFSAERVLIVDDHRTCAEILAGRLAGWHAETSVITEAQAALDELDRACIAGEPYTLAIIDGKMPGIDGRELGRLIRIKPCFAQLRLVYLATGGFRGEARHLAEAGFNGYLTKPTRLHELHKILHDLSRQENGNREPAIATRYTNVDLRDRFKNSSARILLVEDNPTNQLVALGMLKKLGLQADLAQNGVEALTALEKGSYDLVLMDIQMPLMDGLEATRRIRDTNSAVLNHHLPIVALTAHAMRGDAEKCFAAGMNGYLTKPIDPSALVVELGKWIGTTATPPRTTAADIVPPEPFNRSALLERLMGDAELAEAIIQIFLSDAPEQLAAMEASREAGNLEDVARLAHRLKGASANVTGHQLQQAAGAVEQAAVARDHQGLALLLPQLHLRFAELKKKLAC